MELRRLLICMAFVVVACLSHCSEARHSMVRRAADDNYDVLADEASDDAQNDAEGNDPDEEDVVENAIILTQSTNYSVTIGQTVRLECRVSPTDGVVVQWRFNNTNIFMGTLKRNEQVISASGFEDRFFIAPNSTDLLIKDVEPSDCGVYFCEILQENKPYIEHRLEILESPRIIRFTATDNGEVVEGGDLVLTCNVTGSPPPQIVWSRTGQNGANERLMERDGEFSLNSVYIRNVARSHAGKYYCYAFNTVGSNQAELQVVVGGKPKVHVHRSVVNSAVDVEAVLQCAVHDEPASHIRWYKDGVRIEDTSRQYSVSTNGQHSNLTVTPTADEDFGTFTCEAENHLGKHNRSIELVQSPIVENLDVDGPKLSWTIHSHQPLQVIEIQLRDINGDGQWRTVSVPVPEGRNHEYDVVYTLEDQQLESGTYEATVKVKNEKSWSTHSKSAFVDIEAQPVFQHASVYRGGAAPARPAVFVLGTALIYLLVRM